MFIKDLDHPLGSVRRHRVWRYATQVFAVCPIVLPGNIHVVSQHVYCPDYEVIVNR